MPFSFLFLLCVHPEVSCAKGPCSEDLALAMGGATCCNASTPANRRESRRPTPSSSSRQIRARVLCQMGGIVLLALLLGQGASGTKAIACPTLRILLSVTSSLLPSPLGFHLLPPRVRPQASHSLWFFWSHFISVVLTPFLTAISFLLFYFLSVFAVLIPLVLPLTFLNCSPRPGLLTLSYQFYLFFTIAFITLCFLSTCFQRSLLYSSHG